MGKKKRGMEGRQTVRGVAEKKKKEGRERERERGKVGGKDGMQE